MSAGTMPLPRALPVVALVALLAGAGGATGAAEGPGPVPDAPMSEAPVAEAPVAEAPAAGLPGETGAREPPDDLGAAGDRLLDSLRDGAESLDRAFAETLDGAERELERNQGPLAEFYDELAHSLDRLGEAGVAVLDHGRRRLVEALGRLLERFERRAPASERPEVQET